MAKKQDKLDTEAEIRREVGRRIKDLRKKLGHSASRVAKHLDMSREAVTHIETGRNNISAVSLWELATLFNCDISDFFPAVPDGFGITKVDLHKIEQEAPKAADWARKLFKEKSTI